MAYYARKQGEFRDVMSRLEEMARLGAKVHNLNVQDFSFFLGGFSVLFYLGVFSGAAQCGQLCDPPGD